MHDLLNTRRYTAYFPLIKKIKNVILAVKTRKEKKNTYVYV